jgi:fatty acid desaturase
VASSPMTVAALYLGPYLCCNFWLVLYTWLQHTDVDVPHFEGDDWNLVKGGFMTIDRPYGPVLDFLHHKVRLARFPNPGTHCLPIVQSNYVIHMALQD